MRLDMEKIQFLKTSVQSIENEAELYLFGSRIDDSAKGGDIDILILTNELLDRQRIGVIRREFFKRFGWQKLDLLNFRYTDSSVFKDIVLQNAIRL